VNGRELPPQAKPKVADAELAEEPHLVEGEHDIDRGDRMSRVRGARQRIGSELQYRTSGGQQGSAPAHRLETQRQHATHHLRAGLQLRAAPGGGGAAAGNPRAAQAVAEKGLSGGGGGLPHAAAIQRSFGKHDVSQIQAHSGPEAKAATQELGAKAYAAGDQVAFGGGAPDLHTAAHEAAHVVQQRGGVQLAGGVGRDGDEHERHADAVADRVVKGQSAETLLDAAAGPGGGKTSAGVQRKSIAALQFARPADKAAAQALAAGAIKKKPPKLAKGQRSGGTTFGNKEGLLPAKDAAGKAAVTYTEYDVNAYDGVNRDAERVVVGSDGRCWYTADHYKSFTEIK